MKSLKSAALTIAAVVLPISASAETIGYATRADANSLHGIIVSIDGKYGLTVRDDQTGVERVTLHRGTVITPTGLRLKPGLHVTIAGHPDGSAFAANEIVAPAGSLDEQKAAEQPQSSPLTPSAPTSGGFQTNGPSAEGGG
jgi:hypothetical protein